MRLKKWEELPETLRCPEVRPYYDKLQAQKSALLRKRVFDILLSGLGIVLLSPLLLLIAFAVKLDSRGPVFFRQQRVTQYGQVFSIRKFRTMRTNAVGARVTAVRDPRITNVGTFLRRTHLDELGQLFDVFSGHMTFVGTRPEVPAFVARYTPEMRATLLLPAGITSKASLLFSNEAILFGDRAPEEAYLNTVLPEKMRINLEELTQLSFRHELGILFGTAGTVLENGEPPQKRLFEAPAETVSLLIPAYNEDEYLPDLFEDILKQTYPHEKTEIILADSLSSDDTRALMKAFSQAHGNAFRRVCILSNPRRSQAAGWNTCILEAQGDAVIRVDAHSRLPEDFVEKQMRVIGSGEAVSGGVCKRTVKAPTPWRRTLLLAENALFGSGIAPSRRSPGTGKKYVKTLSHTAYRRALFRECGLFDERLKRTEDNEMHFRLRKAGYRLCQDPDIQTEVYIRPKLGALLRQKYGNGYWIGVTVKVCPRCLSLYHFAPAGLVAALIAAGVLAVCGHAVPLQILLGVYAFFALVSTAASAAKEAFTPYFLLVPLLFPLMHLSYGAGTWAGLLFGSVGPKTHETGNEQQKEEI